MDYLRRHKSEIEDDPYTMALVTYALHQEKDMFVINGNVIQEPPKISKDAKEMLAKLEMKAKGLCLVMRLKTAADSIHPH